MDILLTLVDFILHINEHLSALTNQYGTWVYLVLFLIVFAETGLVVTPFLPGDSLLFAAGALAALPNSALNFPLMALILFVAAVLGDAVNYAIGSRVGPAIFRDGSRFLRRDHLEKAHAFYEKYGGKTIIIARFVPIVRTFAPFVAGMARMSYHKFALYNVAGALLWVALCAGGGYLFGNLPVVQENFSLVVLAIIVLSVLPVVIEAVKARRAR